MQFYGVGLNSGKFGYVSSEKIDGKWSSVRPYVLWASMLKRCYAGHKNYLDVTVSNEWLDYQDFADWYYKQPVHKRSKGWQLDKDILIPNNRTYSPQTCRFVPTCINIMARKMEPREFVQGVNWHKKDKSFRAFLCDENGKHVEKGGFKDEYSAFLWYKNKKEDSMRMVAQKYKDVLDHDVYLSLCNYEIVEDKFL